MDDSQSKNTESLYGQYATSVYWDNFYELHDSQHIDWYVKYADLSDIIEKFVNLEDKILVVGAGSSSKW